MTDNSDTVYLSYTPFIPSEVKRCKWKKYFDKYGDSLYVVEVDAENSKYVRHQVRLITDPEYYRRPSYILYDAEAAAGGTLNTAGYLIDQLDLIHPDRVIV